MPPCAICGRAETDLTRHHLLPQCRHRKARFARLHSREEGLSSIALLCKACHSYIHSVLTEKEMELSFNTIEALRQHPDVARFAAWLANKPPGYQPLSRRKR
jgi:hypothetical protein